MTPASVTIVFVRHGETPQHAENRYVGRTDVPLTARGQDQAETLGRWAATAELTGLVSSPLRRSRDTAATVGRLAGLDVRVDERLVELDFGEGEMLTSADMRAAFPEARRAFEEDAFRNPLPGGESPAAATQRVRAVVDELGAGAEGSRVLVVGHGTLLRLLVCDLFGLDPGGYRRILPAVLNASGAVLRNDSHRGWGLVAWNPALASGDPTWTD